MKAVELQAMTDEQLALQLRETSKQLFHLRVQASTERLEAPSEIKKVKKDMARVLTTLRQREIAAAAKLEAASQQGA